ncbi:MAG: spore coat protein [Gammaproteobacteria bacterium]
MILAVLQARMSSRRLPGKVARPILGQPMLARQIERILRASRIEKLVVATSIEPEDDEVEGIAAAAGVGCFRGALDDVLDRFYRATLPHAPSHVVRLTGDCPLTDPAVIDRVVEFALGGDYDYTSNTVRPTWPDGLDVEVVTHAALARAWHEATARDEREHVMPYLWRRPEVFRIGSVEQDTDLSTLRWTVDEPSDFEFVERVYAALYPRDPAFTTAAILELLAHNPSLGAINAGHQRNEGLLNPIGSNTDD